MHHSLSVASLCFHVQFMVLIIVNLFQIWRRLWTIWYEVQCCHFAFCWFRLCEWGIRLHTVGLYFFFISFCGAFYLSCFVRSSLACFISHSVLLCSLSHFFPSFFLPSWYPLFNFFFRSCIVPVCLLCFSVPWFCEEQLSCGISAHPCAWNNSATLRWLYAWE